MSYDTPAHTRRAPPCTNTFFFALPHGTVCRRTIRRTRHTAVCGSSALFRPPEAVLAFFCSPAPSPQGWPATFFTRGRGAPEQRHRTPRPKNTKWKKNLLTPPKRKPPKSPQSLLPTLPRMTPTSRRTQLPRKRAPPQFGEASSTLVRILASFSFFFWEKKVPHFFSFYHRKQPCGDLQGC